MIATMNNTLKDETENIPTIPFENKLNYFIGILIAFLIGSASVVGNGLVLHVLRRNPKLLGSTRKFCLHLAVTDLGNGLLIFAKLIQNFITFEENEYFRPGKDINRDIVCVPLNAVVILLSYASLAILTINNVERYLAICRRSQYVNLMTKKTSHALLVGSWVFAVVVASLSFVGLEGLGTGCVYQRMYKNWLYLVHALIMISLSTFNAVLFTFILRKARSFYNRISPAAMNGLNSTASKNRGMRTSIKRGKIMGLVTMFFILCWIPLSATQIYFGLIDASSRNYHSFSVTTFMYILASSNSTINPFIYSWQKKEFRESCKKYLRCRRSNQINAVL